MTAPSYTQGHSQLVVFSADPYTQMCDVERILGGLATFDTIICAAWMRPNPKRSSVKRQVHVALLFRVNMLASCGAGSNPMGTSTAFRG